MVHGKLLIFVNAPMESKLPGVLFLSTVDRAAVDTAMIKFVDHIIVELCPPGDQRFISNVSPTIKKDGTARVILNMKDRNNHVEHFHFKLNTLKDVIPLIYPTCFFTTIDLEDAYFL